MAVSARATGVVCNGAQACLRHSLPASTEFLHLKAASQSAVCTKSTSQRWFFFVVVGFCFIYLFFAFQKLKKLLTNVNTSCQWVVAQEIEETSAT